MLRALLIVVLIVGLVAAAVFGPSWVMSAKGKADHEPLALDACDLLDDDCQWEADGSSWQASLKPLHKGSQGTEYQLTIRTEASPERFLAVLRGESMYLGQYPVPLTPIATENTSEGLTWRARFTAPFCTTDPEMFWRIDLQSGEEAIEGTPAKLIFQAEPDF